MENPELFCVQCAKMTFMPFTDLWLYGVFSLTTKLHFHKIATSLNPSGMVAGKMVCWQKLFLAI